MPKRYRDLRHYLSDTKTTQATFAERVGVKQTAISRIVNGARVPRLALALRIAAEANIPLESLIQKRGKAA
jgi:transcriptional regulator with XRE-family HTH domain